MQNTINAHTGDVLINKAKAKVDFIPYFNVAEA